MKQKHLGCKNLQEKLLKSDVSYISAPKNGIVHKEYLEDASHLKTCKHTRKKLLHLCVCFCWYCRHLEWTSKTNQEVVTAYASVNCTCVFLCYLILPRHMGKTDLCCCFLVHTLLKGPQHSTNRILSSLQSCHANLFLQIIAYPA